MKNNFAKLAASKEADEALDHMLLKVNEGFTGGRVTKIDLVSWIILQFRQLNFEKNIAKIQKDHFDHLPHLEGLLKKIKKARRIGETDEETERLLRQVVDSTQKQRICSGKVSEEVIS